MTVTVAVIPLAAAVAPIATMPVIPIVFVPAAVPVLPVVALMVDPQLATYRCTSLAV